MAKKKMKQNKLKISRKKVKMAAKPGKAKKAKKVKLKIKGPQHVFLGLGSNVGDREEYIEQAVFLLGKLKGVEILKRSSNYETQAEGNVEQPPFLNAAVEIKTALPPQKLLKHTHDIENALGREREVEWGPRTIDIDILIYGNLILSEDELQVPHPLLHERMFVLMPLKEISPNFPHPVLEKSFGELFEDKKVESGATYDDELPGFKEIRKAGYDDYERW